tara:strand:+ start:86 stop:451 length:366 start_codon:yes stop_codon:yes gene_type:complete
MTLDNNLDDNEGNLDSFARYLFLFLIFFSVVNDSFSIYNNVMENQIVKDNINYFKDLSDAFVGILSNKEKKIKDGIIIKNKKKEEKEEKEDKVEKEVKKEKKRSIIKKNIFKNTLMDEITN